jgi:hypothetical protein
VELGRFNVQTMDSIQRTQFAMKIYVKPCFKTAAFAAPSQWFVIIIYMVITITDLVSGFVTFELKNTNYFKCHVLLFHTVPYPLH